MSSLSIIDSAILKNNTEKPKELISDTMQYQMEAKVTDYLLQNLCSPTAIWLDGANIKRVLKEQYVKENYPIEYSFNEYLIDNGCRIND